MTPFLDTMLKPGKPVLHTAHTSIGVGFSYTLMRHLVNSASQFASSAVCHVNASGPYLRLALTEKWRVTKSSSLRAADHFRALRLECPTDLFCKEGPVINYFTRHGRKLALDSALGPLLITAPGSYCTCAPRRFFLATYRSSTKF